MPKQARFEVFKGHGNVKDVFYWHLKAPNSEIVCQSEGYQSKQAAMDTVAALKRFGVNALVIDLDRE